jgi:hypothetical protein
VQIPVEYEKDQSEGLIEKRQLMAAIFVAISFTTAFNDEHVKHERPRSRNAGIKVGFSQDQDHARTRGREKRDLQISRRDIK